MKTKLIIISIAVFLITAMVASSQQYITKKSDTTSNAFKRGPYFVDKNNDGICDNRPASKPAQTYQGRNYVDNNKDGVCDNRQYSGTAQTYKGRNYVDNNKDGVCDNRQNNNTGYCCGRGNGYCKGNGNGCQHRHGWRNGNGNHRGWNK